MDRVENTARRLSAAASILALLLLGACAGDPLRNAGRVVPTARPDIRVTPAPAQDVRGTATAFARQIIPTPTPAGLYVVKPGDTLSKIADEHATTIDEIMAANNLSDPDLIAAGQHLTIPSGDAFSDATAAVAQEPTAPAEIPVETSTSAAETSTPAP